MRRRSAAGRAPRRLLHLLAKKRVPLFSIQLVLYCARDVHPCCTRDTVRCKCAVPRHVDARLWCAVSSLYRVWRGTVNGAAY